MKNRLTNSILLGTVALGIYIGLQLGSGFGLGRGAGPGGKPDESVVGGNTKTRPPAAATSVGDPTDDLLTPDSPRRDGKSVARQLLTVVVVKDGYHLCEQAEIEDNTPLAELPLTPISLEDLVQATVHAVGNESHIRLRVYREKTATAGDWSDLQNALKDANVPMDDIQVIKGVHIL